MNPVGYSGTPLAKKLGIKPGMTLSLINEPDNYKELVGEVLEQVKISSKGKADLIHFFTEKKAEFEKHVDALREAIFPDGMVWVSWPKKSAKTGTDLTEDIIRDIALAHGLVDVKVCAVDEKWSGLKLVIRLKDRKVNNQ
jgi:hypothetical protein